MSKGYEEVKDHGLSKISFLVHGTDDEVDKDCRIDLFRGIKSGSRAEWIDIDEEMDNHHPGTRYVLGNGEWMTRSKARRLGEALIALSKRKLPPKKGGVNDKQRSGQ